MKVNCSGQAGWTVADSPSPGVKTKNFLGDNTREANCAGLLLGRTIWAGWFFTGKIHVPRLLTGNVHKYTKKKKQYVLCKGKRWEATPPHLSNDHQSRGPTRGWTKKCGPTRGRSLDKPVIFIPKYEKKLRSDRGSDRNMRSDRGSVVRQDGSLDKGGGTHPVFLFRQRTNH